MNQVTLGVLISPILNDISLSNRYLILFTMNNNRFLVTQYLLGIKNSKNVLTQLHTSPLNMYGSKILNKLFILNL